MRTIVNALAESANLCTLAQESADPFLQRSARRVMVLLEKATDRVIQIKEDTRDGNK